MNQPDERLSARAIPLRLLIVEDSADDAVLLVQTLRRAGYVITHQRVDTPEEMRTALEQGPWDLVLADYFMPRFSGLAALDILREKGLDLPFIIVSGRIGEDAAVEAMKAGAHDYVMKDHPKRLIPAVERELREAQVRRDRNTERRRAEEALKAERRRFHDVLELLPAGVMLVAPDYSVLFANRLFRERFGEFNGKRCFEFLARRDRPCRVCEMKQVQKASTPLEWEATGVDGRNYHIFHFPFTDSDGATLTLAMGIDITERERAEAELRRYREHLEELVRQRTEEIEARNARLAAEIAERKQAEEALRDRENQLRALNETLEHRVTERTAEVQDQAEKLRALAADLSRVEQQERKRLAKVLHDHIQQLLVAAQMHLGALKLEATPGGRGAPLTQAIESILAEAIEASRSLAVELSPPVLHEVGLIAGLEWLADHVREQSHFRVEVESDNGTEPAEEEVRLLLFECVRELLLNAIKHSGQSQAAVTVEHTPDKRIKITVADAGKGFDPSLLKARSKKTPTFGLFSIQQRLTHLGGSVQIETAPGHGVRVTLLAPLGKHKGTQ
ncbi:MAG: response regulator [Acidobacteriia bacterium]|nr:response regulator [Terriglobia bacterium]